MSFTPLFSYSFFLSPSFLFFFPSLFSSSRLKKNILITVNTERSCFFNFPITLINNASRSFPIVGSTNIYFFGLLLEYSLLFSSSPRRSFHRDTTMIAALRATSGSSIRRLDQRRAPNNPPEDHQHRVRSDSTQIRLIFRRVIARLPCYIFSSNGLNNSERTQ